MKTFCGALGIKEGRKEGVVYFRIVEKSSK
jgi:hypothetical protein